LQTRLLESLSAVRGGDVKGEGEKGAWEYSKCYLKMFSSINVVTFLTIASLNATIITLSSQEDIKPKTKSKFAKKRDTIEAIDIGLV